MGVISRIFRECGCIVVVTIWIDKKGECGIPSDGKYYCNKEIVKQHEELAEKETQLYNISELVETGNWGDFYWEKK